MSCRKVLCNEPPQRPLRQPTGARPAAARARRPHPAVHDRFVRARIGLVGQLGESKFNSLLGDTLAQLATTYGTTDQTKWLTAATKHAFQPTNFIGYPQAGADETLTLPMFMNRGYRKRSGHLQCVRRRLVVHHDASRQSGFIDPSGAKSKHYSDQLSLYQRFECKSEWSTEGDVDSHREAVTTLNY